MNNLDLSVGKKGNLKRKKFLRVYQMNVVFHIYGWISISYVNNGLKSLLKLVFKISFAKPGKERLSERKIYVFIDNEMLNYIFNYILPLMIVLVRQMCHIQFLIQILQIRCKYTL